ncbi:MAG: 16S rRNA (adenine(1518)-N(6)/adenine(1519)-N(6))-dimethyltransferase RsmA [Pseudomonadota bacterium]
MPFQVPDKKLAQHFLKDNAIIHKILQTRPTGAKSVLEVGPGNGVLTEHLALMDLPLMAIEKDERFQADLCHFVSPQNLIMADALEVNISQLLEQKSSAMLTPVWLVSNLPYNQGVPLLLHFLLTPKIHFLTVMLQKEVGEKLMPEKYRNGMNSLGALTSSYFDIRQVCAVPPKAFFPPPEVDSMVLYLARKVTPDFPNEEWKKWEKFLRQVFAHKRKQLGTVLKPFFPNDKIKPALEETGIDTQIRAEALPLSKLQQLYRKLTQEMVR